MTSPFSLFNNNKARRQHQSDADRERDGYLNEITQTPVIKSTWGAVGESVGADYMPFLMFGLN